MVSQTNFCWRWKSHELTIFLVGKLSKKNEVSGIHQQFAKPEERECA